MRQTISFSEGDDYATLNGEVSILLKDVSMVSVKQILSALIENIDDMYADFYVNGHADVQYPDRLRDAILRSLREARVQQIRTPREQ